MRELFLYPITGLYNECHEVDYEAMVGAAPPCADGPYCLRDINNLWWKHALSESTLRTIVARLEARYGPTMPSTEYHRLVLAAPDKFVAELIHALRLLSDLGAGPRASFRALEALNIFTILFSDFISAPYTLSLQEGLLVNELSSLELARTALLPPANPYYDFLAQYAFPVIEQSEATLIWMVGPVKISTIAMAMWAKRHLSSCHISIVGHSSEYYSLNKIAKHLIRNTVLFETVDSVVLDDFENTPPQLRTALAHGQPLSIVPNLMYADRDAGEIKQTSYVTAPQTLDFATHLRKPSDKYEDMRAPFTQVAESRLWPSSKCYWNACNFCAINKRYQTLPKNSFAGEAERANYMMRLADEGARYLWSVDEAIPPRNLGELADELITRGSPIIWETRSKIDKNFTPEICQKLGKSGLREIRLGLESANPRVLSIMGKFPEGWSLDLIEQVVSNFHHAGVSVHFPTIVGFPTETAEERNETFAFLEYLIAKYPSMTFNTNILGFDVASKLFEQYEQFGITTVRWPAPAKYFLGNLLDWECDEVPFDFDGLDTERNEQMRRLLYPWMPTTASIPTYIFYRLTETSRATMVWKAQRAETGNWSDEWPVDDAARLITSPGVVIIGPMRRGKFDTEDRYHVYDWWTHRSFDCDTRGYETLRYFFEPTTLAEFEGSLAENHINDATGRLNDCQELVSLGVLRPVESSSSPPNRPALVNRWVGNGQVLVGGAVAPASAASQLVTLQITPK